jgi:hypothetical protein
MPRHTRKHGQKANCTCFAGRPTLIRFGNSRLRTVHEFTVDPRELAIAVMAILRIVIHYAIRTLVRKSMERVNTTILPRPWV